MVQDLVRQLEAAVQAAQEQPARWEQRCGLLPAASRRPAQLISSICCFSCSAVYRMRTKASECASTMHARHTWLSSQVAVRRC